MTFQNTERRFLRMMKFGILATYCLVIARYFLITEIFSYNSDALMKRIFFISIKMQHLVTRAFFVCLVGFAW